MFVLLVIVLLGIVFNPSNVIRSRRTGSYRAGAVVGTDMITCLLAVMTGDPEHNEKGLPGRWKPDARNGRSAHPRP